MRRIVGTSYRPFEAIRVFATMAFEYQPAQSEQAGAIVAGRIEATGNLFECALRNDRAEHVDPAFAELTFEHALDQTAKAFG